MRFIEIRPRAFRNLPPDLAFAPDARFNVITGRNAQGKTNLLEAAYFVATLKPLRAARLADLVRWGESQAAVEASAEVEGITRSIQVEIVAGRRTAKVDDKIAGRPADYLRRAPTVIAFIPDDLEIAKGGPGARRRFLDRAVFGYDAAYLTDLRAYNRSLVRRNGLLRVPSLAAIDRDVLAAFDEQLARLGASVVARRTAFLREVGPLAEEVHARIAGGHPAPPAFAYEARARTEDELRDALRDRLVRDHATGTTSIGPHRDDLSLTLEAQPLRLMASQGQQRTVILALKIAEIALASVRHRAPPVLLLDDVASELDNGRAAALFDHLRSFHDGQVLVTTTDRERVPLEARDHVREWVVSEGRVVAAAAA